MDPQAIATSPGLSFMGLICAIPLIAIVSLIGALFVKLAARIVISEWIPYGDAYKACFMAAIAGALISWIVQCFSPSSGEGMMSNIFALIISFFVSSSIYGNKILHPNTGAIGFAKGILVSLVLYGIAVVLAIIIVMMAVALGIGLGLAST